MFMHIYFITKNDYLNLVTKWWMKMSMFNLASSFPGQECTPFPNGIKVFGFGGTCMIHTQFVMQVRLLFPFFYLKNILKKFHRLFIFSLQIYIAYLKSWWVKTMRSCEKFWIMMDVPEQWHHFPSFWYQISWTIVN